MYNHDRSIRDTDSAPSSGGDGSGGGDGELAVNPNDPLNYAFISSHSYPSTPPPVVALTNTIFTVGAIGSIGSMGDFDFNP